MGHKEIAVRRVVPAPPAAVFATLLDRSHWPEWSGHTGFEPVRPGAAGPYDVGSVGLLRSGRRRVVREEILEVTPDRRIGYAAEHGLADLSLRTLAAGLGTSHRMLIFHFGSKEGCWSRWCGRSRPGSGSCWSSSGSTPGSTRSARCRPSGGT